MNPLIILLGSFIVLSVFVTIIVVAANMLSSKTSQELEAASSDWVRDEYGDDADELEYAPSNGEGFWKGD